MAQQIAITRPDRVDRLVLIGSTATTRDNPVVRALLIDGLLEGPWRARVEHRGVEWPAGAWALTPIEVGAEAAAWIREQWVTEPAADSALLAVIASETERVPLGTWLGTIRALIDLDAGHASRIATIAAPTLVLWATQDAIFPEVPDQANLREALEVAARRNGVVSFWKAYGSRGLPENGIPDGEIGHNLHWGTAADVAADLAAFLQPGGAPTRDLVAGDPGRANRLRREPGVARVVVLGAGECD